MKTKILYIEDEPNLGCIVQETLIRNGYDVCWNKNGEDVLQQILQFKPDICILDIMLPKMDGHNLCTLIKRSFPEIPIIFLTARTKTEDLLKGFECGCTDYIKKPFSMEELLVRIKTQLSLHGRALKTIENEQEEIEFGDYKYHPLKFMLETPDEILKLTSREGEVLEILIASGTKFIDRKQLLIKIWGDDSFFNSRNLDVYIRKLRKIFKDDPAINIRTVKGKGYIFIVNRD